jgi:ATP-binding cassette, subfamily C (CFTR/MRP), member 1
LYHVTNKIDIQALARAVYSKKPVLLLDDVMSGLDADTENIVFHRLLGRNGLLRQYGITVIAASSAGMFHEISSIAK